MRSFKASHYNGPRIPPSSPRPWLAGAILALLTGALGSAANLVRLGVGYVAHDYSVRTWSIGEATVEQARKTRANGAAVVSYRYSVNGTAFSGTDTAPITDQGPFQPNRQVPIRIHPDHPAVSRLAISASDFKRRGLLSAALLILCMGGVGLVARHGRERKISA